MSFSKVSSSEYGHSSCNGNGNNNNGKRGRNSQNWSPSSSNPDKGSPAPSTATKKGRRPHHPLVAILDSADCSIEFPQLKDIATLAFCNASSMTEIHERVLNEAVGIFLTHQLTLDREDLENFKSLKLIVRLGSGISNVDLQAAADLGIAVSNISGAETEEVADSTLSLMLNLYRRTHWLANEVKAATIINSVGLVRSSMFGTTRIRGETLGIVGFGRIGRAVAMRAKAFGFNVIFFDPYLPVFTGRDIGICRCETLRDLLVLSDCITLHCQLNEANFQMINREAIASMRHGVFFINTAHGLLVDENALADALRSGQIGGAGLDVHDNEGTLGIFEGPFAGIKNIIATPHTSYYSQASDRELRDHGCEEMKRGLLGTIPGSLKNCVNLTALNSSIFFQQQQQREQRQASPFYLMSAPAVGGGVDFDETEQRSQSRGADFSTATVAQQLLQHFGLAAVSSAVTGMNATNVGHEVAIGAAATGIGGGSCAAAVRDGTNNDGEEEDEEEDGPQEPKLRKWQGK